MNAELDLSKALAEWRRLAQAEGQAIRSGNWSFLSECQAALRQLQTVIDGFVSKSQPANQSEDTLPSRSSHRSSILELIELQRRNLAALQERRQRLSNHIEQLSRSGRNLRGIQRSYAPAGPAAWSSYS